ncbi:MAG TPA: hypothetical protein VFG50_05225 [Rhodothermales bacterium]|nr:hypothetical protein [Rhodothermales bacterium]
MCSETMKLGLEVVDGMQLDEQFRNVLKPAGLMKDRNGSLRRLPRFFYRIDSWQMARETELAPGFSLWEFINVDVQEAEPQRLFPRYVPCAVSVLAASLSVLRQRVGTYVHIAANGGYRSPSHALSHSASTHNWGTGANIYRVGDDYLDTEEKIERYRKIVQNALPAAWTLPYGEEVGCCGDHLHVDIGYVNLVPPGAPSEEDQQEAEKNEYPP